MDYARWKRWVTASSSLTRFAEMLQLPAQQLGRFDCLLAAESPSFIQSGTDVERATAFQDHLGLSYLWILGGYELIRTVDQRCRSNPSLISAELSARARQVKKTFERVRIPLAKFEPANSHRDTDFTFAWPAYHPDRGIAWAVAPNTFISRSELAELLLGFLEALHATV